MNPYLMMHSNAIHMPENEREERRRIRRMEQGIMPRRGVVQRDKSWQVYALALALVAGNLILFVQWWTMA